MLEAPRGRSGQRSGGARGWSPRREPQAALPNAAAGSRSSALRQRCRARGARIAVVAGGSAVVTISRRRRVALDLLMPPMSAPTLEWCRNTSARWRPVRLAGGRQDGSASARSAVVCMLSYCSRSSARAGVAATPAARRPSREGSGRRSVRAAPDEPVAPAARRRAVPTSGRLRAWAQPPRPGRPEVYQGPTSSAGRRR